MKQRTNTYLRSFPNTPEGNAQYKQFISDCRRIGLKGGRFCKMFRGNKRKHREFTGWGGQQVKMWNGCNVKEGATHFDVYLHYGFNPKTQRIEQPMFFNFSLKAYSYE